jgi:hypothetical protein
LPTPGQGTVIVGGIEHTITTSTSGNGAITTITDTYTINGVTYVTTTLIDPPNPPKSGTISTS